MSEDFPEFFIIIKPIHVSTFQHRSLEVLSARRNDDFLSFTGMKEVYFNTYHQYAEYYKHCRPCVSAHLFLFPLHIWVNMWQSLLYHTAWYTLQESCWSYVVRVLSLKWNACHIVFTSFSFISGIFFLETVCVEQFRDEKCAKCARMHGLEQSKQYTTFPKVSRPAWWTTQPPSTDTRVLS